MSRDLRVCGEKSLLLRLTKRGPFSYRNGNKIHRKRKIFSLRLSCHESGFHDCPLDPRNTVGSDYTGPNPPEGPHSPRDPLQVSPTPYRQCFEINSFNKKVKSSEDVQTKDKVYTHTTRQINSRTPGTPVGTLTFPPIPSV